MATKKKQDERKYVVICTDKRGVFGGYLESGDVGQVVVLSEARMCLYWQRGLGGVLGLSVSGPKSECRIGAAAPQGRFPDVHCILDCTTEARDAWIAAPVYR